MGEWSNAGGENWTEEVLHFLEFNRYTQLVEVGEAKVKGQGWYNSLNGEGVMDLWWRGMMHNISLD